MRKIISLFLVILIFTLPMLSFGQLDFELNSKAAILMDYNTGDIIFKINEDAELTPASITKIMTLLLTMEALENNQLNLQDEVIISEYASSMGGTQIYLEPGEAQSIENLIKAVSIRSANDAAVALGEAIAGSNEVFVSMMNQRAQQLGMENTNFVNATGLPADNHYTSAYDISIMTKELLNHEKIIEYLTIYMDNIYVGKNNDDLQTMVNTNRLVRHYDGTTGVKTGFTNEAGHCLSASAKRGDMQLIAVVLGADNSTNRFDEARKLLDYGFSAYDSILLERKYKTVSQLSVEKGDMDLIDLSLERDSYALIPKNQDYSINRELILPDSIIPPVKKGEVVGQLNLFINDKKVDSIDLVSKVEVNESNYFNILKKTIKTFISN